MVSVILTIDPIQDEKLLEGIKAQFVDFYIVNERNGRHLVDAVVKDPAVIPELEQMLQAYNPVIVGMWNPDGTEYGTEKVIAEDGTEGITGTPIYPFDSQEYLGMMPDEIVTDADGNVVSTSRPAQAKELHNWAGWKKRRM